MPEAPVQDRLVPSIRFQDELPVAARRDEIAELINKHQVLIVAGETGSGKTTQLPKICLQLGRGRRARIGHTQPRRLAARTVAARIAEELDTTVGELVGYQVRFHDQVSDASAIKLMTDGILLAEVQRDRLLRQYDTLIIDEAHERSLNIDFLLGYLKRILPRRPDLKLIITSATIDLESFSRHFDDAPIIEVSGRSYPVETHYFDPAEDRDQGLQEQIITLVEEIDHGRFGARGDVLIFLPGERDIRELSKRLRHSEGLVVLPLYSRLSQAEQNRVFAASRSVGMRVVLATNVAETSVTVPGIRYVIDPGDARVSRYSYRTKMQRLPIEAISQASANQRRGRCGRVAAGVCFRLYSEEDFAARPHYTDPEIVRTNLAAVILQMLQLGLGQLADFPFIDPPDSRLVRDGYKLLEELAAVTEAGKLTKLGRAMATLPLDPRPARMILAARERGCVEEALIIASALAIPDPRERPADKQQQADQMHARFRHPRSDFMAWLNLWRYYEAQRQSLSQNQLRKLCQREFLSFLRMREWRDLHAQLIIACRQQKLNPKSSLPEDENYEAVHRALLAGLLSNVAQWHEGREYLGSRNRKLQIFPGSSQARKRPKWLVAAEVVETSQVFAREVAAIDPRWILDSNPALLKYYYHQPRWDSRSGRVMAYERVALYGLTIADKRSVHYGPLAPVEARELLIREGLIAGNYRRPPAFLRHNQRLVRELEDLESRARRRDILADEQVLFDFYAERLPASGYTAGRLQAWLKAEPDADRSLRIPRELLLARDPGSQLEQQFPDTLDWGDMQFRLSYQFEPGGESDGVSVTVPVGLLNRVPRYRFEWLVPGLLREKCVQLVKSLPKDKRKRLVPAPDFVDRALTTLEVGNASLLDGLADALSRLGGVSLRSADWQWEKLDDFYLMNIRVVDAENKLLAQGRNLASLIERFRGDTRETISSASEASPARAGIIRWDIESLPTEWRFRQAGVDIVSYPAVVDNHDAVAIELFDYPEQARLQHRLGVLRLARLHNKQQVKYLHKQLLRGNASQLLLARAGQERGVLMEDIIDAAYVQVLQLNEQLPYDRAAFSALLQRGGAAVVEHAIEFENQILTALTLLADSRQKMTALGSKVGKAARADIEQQLARLWQAGFMRDTSAVWLTQYPRYMKALVSRIERLAGQLPRDEKHTSMLTRLTEPLLDTEQARPGLLLLSAEACQYRWMLEEFRVSLFAQNLGTRLPVSEKRLLEQWGQVVKAANL